MPSVRETLRGRTVLVTGGAGFLAPVLIDRLLSPSTALDVKRVYTLVRGPDALKRLPAFLVPYAQTGRLVVIEGDCSKVGFGMDGREQDWMDEVEIVLHTAADTKFNNPLRKTIDSNAAMAYAMAHFSLMHPNVLTHVHVSTCYATCNLPDGYHAFEEIDFSQATYEAHANTYAQAKLIGEGVVDVFARTGSGTAWSVVRIDTVTPSLRFPEPDYGAALAASPLVALALTEIIPDNLVRPDYLLDCTPVDIVADQLIALACSTHHARRSPLAHCLPSSIRTPVFHISTPTRAIPPSLWNAPSFTIARPVVSVRVWQKAYETITNRVSVIRNERAMKAMGLSCAVDAEAGYGVPCGHGQRIPDVKLDEVVSVDTNGLVVDAEKAIDEAGGWAVVLPRIKTKVEQARTMKPKKKELRVGASASIEAKL